MSSAPTLFESLNARALLPEQVGANFIQPPSFPSLIRQGHTVVLGPRGSGKTTMLKMLELAGLSAWTGREATRTKALIDFVGVFVPSDLVWQAQIEGPAIVPHPELHNELLLIGQAAFHNHILSAFVSAVEQRLHLDRATELGRFTMVMSPEKTQQAASEICRQFFLARHTASISSIRHGLESRMSRLQLLRNRLLRTSKFAPSDEIENLIDLDFLAALGAASAVIEDCADGDKFRWALCFDELELAPSSVRSRVMGMLRSTDDRFLFKVALSPYNEEIGHFDVIGHAQVGHDYEIVNLTHSTRIEIDSFSADLANRLVRTRLGHGDAASVLHRSITADSGRDAKGPAYKPGSRQQLLVKRLAESDSTFADYLVRRRIDINQLHEMSEPLLRRHIRKVIHYVAVRDAYRPPDGGGSARHVGLMPYTGVPLVYALCEGNPRLLIGVISSMLRDLDSRNDTVDAARQAAVYRDAASRLRSLLRALGTLADDGGGGMSLLRFLDTIGSYFRSVSIGGPFTTDPPGTFVVDPRAALRFGKLVGLGLNVGALIHAPANRRGEHSEMSDIAGQRFRLCYLLAAYHHLPIRLEREVMLSTIVERSALAGGEITVEHTELRLPGMAGADE